MNLQYISDSKGNTTGVYIPINEWNAFREKYRNIEDEAGDNVPEWHKDIVLERLKNYENNAMQALDFDEAMNDIEKEL